MDFHDLTRVSLSATVRSNRSDPSKDNDPVESLMEHLAYVLNREDGLFIGHIKALVLAPDGNYHALSITGPEGPVGHEGILLTVDEVKLILVVLVFGGTERVLEERIKATATIHLESRGFALDWESSDKVPDDTVPGLITFGA